MKTQASGVVNFWFYKGGGERLGWWTSDFTLGVVNIWGGECLILQRGWWTSGVVNVWYHKGGGERLGWLTSGVVDVWFYTGGGECLRWWTSGLWTSDFTLGVVNVWVVNVLQSKSNRISGKLVKVIFLVVMMVLLVRKLGQLAHIY